MILCKVFVNNMAEQTKIGMYESSIDWHSTDYINRLNALLVDTYIVR